ncbi:MAG TPA: SAM-dependent methyltransferase [Solirubrobacteraceae bacterium]|jgi:methyltransferase (TIGR00027 family)|nr:SAM-dependent methyltransferase [Solirubrobacteraceae bacterium]
MKTGTPSRTAEYMALFRALESARPEGKRLFEDRTAASFLRPSLRAVALAARFGPTRSLIFALIDRRWPGPRLSGVVRTRVIDDFVTAAMQAGATQLVLLGAGYDTRATRLPAAAASIVFEIDHPITQARKRAALGDVSERVCYVPLDFESDALQPALIDAGLDQSQRTCVLWEGVFSYLTPEAIDATLATLVEVCAPGSQILLTYVDQRFLDTTNPQAGAWFTAVHDAGEPFQTGLDPGQAPAFFAARNLALLGDESTTHAACRLGVPKAHTIPDMYRLATLQITPASPQA